MGLDWALAAQGRTLSSFSLRTSLSLLHSEVMHRLGMLGETGLSQPGTCSSRLKVQYTAGATPSLIT